MAHREAHIFKIYQGPEYIASAKHAQDAIFILAMAGETATIKYKHKKILLTHSQIQESIEASIALMDSNYEAWRDQTKRRQQQ